MKTLTLDLVKKWMTLSFFLCAVFILNASTNFSYSSNVLTVSDTTDTDGDGILDDVDIDDDNDGIPDVDEGSYIPSASFNVLITIDLDAYEEETSWDLEDDQGHVLLSGNNYGNSDDVVTASMVINHEGVYTLNVYDSWGDGMDYSSGSNTNGTSGFSITVNGTEVYNSGNEPSFGYSTAASFTLGAATTYPISVHSQSGVSSNDKIEGAPDNKYAKWYSTGDIMIVDFGAIYSQGTEYEITWKGRKNNKNAILVLEESTTSSNFTYHNSFPSTNNNSIRTDIVVSDNDFRYLRISQNSQFSSEDFQIDAIGLISGSSNDTLPVFMDSDHDGIANSQDLDSDNDGIADIIEAGGVDADNNGMVDGNFIDFDGDGWSSEFDLDEGGIMLSDDDSDNDGFSNRVDVDSDDDGIVDLIESVNSTTVLTLLGTNGNLNGVDSIFRNGFIIPLNTDNSDEPDYLDLDSDNDNHSDFIEANDLNNDQSADISLSGMDTDEDGLDDAFDLINVPGSLTNSSNSQDASFFPNNNNIGNPELDWRERFNLPNDHDNDGIADNMDADKDGDGIDDFEECFTEMFSFSGGNNGSTANFNYTDPILARFDFDWIDNDIDIEINGVRLYDDVMEFQANTNQGNLMVTENGGSLLSAPWVANNNGLPRVRIVIDQFGSAQVLATQSANSTELERLVFSNPATAGEYVLNTGVNSFKVINGNGPGPDGYSVKVYLSSLANCDQDGDSIPNFLDLDSDNDGVTDLVEDGGVDLNGDGREDPESLQGAEVVTASSVDKDFDGDGIPNRLDIDSDSDGIIDHIESQTTNNFTDHTNQDTDIDGWDNSYDPDNGGTVISLSDNDHAGNHDYLSTDADGDAFPDWMEAFDDDRSGDALNDLIIRADNFEVLAAQPGFYVNTDDADADGIPDWLEDDDADGNPNFLDPDHLMYQDSDQDGLVDLFDTDTFGQGPSLPNSDNAGDKDFRDGSQGISLPIVLQSFDAIRDENRVRINWVTSAEINNDYFEVERSVNGEDFEVISKVFGAGNSNMNLTYETYDNDPAHADNYYRLRQVDFDGKNTVSHIRVVPFGSNNNVKKPIEGCIYPNPNNGENLFIELESPDLGLYEVQFLDMKGNLLNRQQFSVIEGSYFKMEMQNGMDLKSGTYIINIVHGNQIKRFIYVVNQL